jgi:nuclear pore complex protein Nup160
VLIILQCINAAELLRMYLDYDLLEEASHLTVEYIDAVLGKGSEYLGLTSYLHAGAPAIWLPYTCIDQLMLALQETNNPILVQVQHTSSFNTH